MFSLITQRWKTGARITGRRRSKPKLEGLEDRMMLTASGGLWSMPDRITYSFVPDGTNIGGVSSNLFTTLNKVAPTVTWQQAIQKAAAVWSSYANINLSLVPDNGTSAGTSCAPSTGSPTAC